MSTIVKAVCQHCQRVTTVPAEAISAATTDHVVGSEPPHKIDRERAAEAAMEANNAYGQWMPERWLHLFLDAYEGKR